MKNIKTFLIVGVLTIFTAFSVLAKPTMGVVVKIGGIPWFNAMEVGIKEQGAALGVDAYMIGPYDLSGSLKKPGQFDDSEVKDAIETIIQAGKKHNIAAGFHSVSSDPHEAYERQQQGFTFLAFSTDAILLGDASISAMKQLKVLN